MSKYLAASIGLADGRVLRIGPDEDQVGDIPTGFSFQTQMPGGFGPASLTIARPPDLYADDARLFSDVVVYGEGMTIIYEGYVTGLPQQSQDEIQIQLTGWSTILDRIVNFRQVFVDRDMTKWRPPSADRKLLLKKSFGATGVNGPAIGTGNSTEPALITNVSASANQVEAWFDAGPGLLVSEFYYSRIEHTGGINGLNLQAGFSNNDVTISEDPQTTLTLAGKSVTPPSQPTRYAYIRVNGNFDREEGVSIFGLAVYGNSGLTKVEPAPWGVFGSEAIGYMVGATPLNLLPESIESSDFVIPHLSFTQDISVREAIEHINVFGGVERLPNDWGVYDRREFFWKSPGTYGKTWRISSENLTNVRSDGPDSALRTSGVKVNYQDQSGVTRSVGPPNSFSDFETQGLLSVDMENPAFRIPSFHTESVGVTSRQGAINIGKVLLGERNRLNWRGELELQGEVMDSEGKIYPVHRIRAGDQVIVQDDDDKRPRPVNSTTYNHDNMSLLASLGAIPDTLDSLLARLAAVTDLTV